MTEHALRISGENDIREWMIGYVGKVLAVPAENFPTGATFDSYGLDSVEAVVMAGVMEEEFGIQIDPIELFDHPSVDQFAAALAARMRVHA